MRKISLRLRLDFVALALTASLPASSLDTGQIISSAVSTDCLAYRITGVCFWLRCGLSGCSVRSTVKVRHYVPDAVVSSYSNTGGNPWGEVAFMSPPNPTAEGGGSGTSVRSIENNLAKFKNADVIGHPGHSAFSAFAREFGVTCAGVGRPMRPYFLSTLDSTAWRYNIPELSFPEALIPGQREIGARLSMNLWGNVYPRGGFLHQVDDYKAAAVVAQRAGDLVTRTGQLHVYQPLVGSTRDGYWPAGALIEGNEESGKWQQLTPRLSSSCAVFPHAAPLPQSQDGAYAWALWRPYSCCSRAGQWFIGDIDVGN